ncbi:hypothetical protein [Saliterribacillus persicus]|uniref:DUF3993 domain-containing protein n=1 Tax=Saliterribacillus persicus TaxID=930114 RepID=A0A368XG24_9BACI|nr:hypothetical protein [Saliterribacillus persicus]RCW66913.1 hypothetical protein DFR57_1088 [Saliterribacillus persicus]
MKKTIMSILMTTVLVAMTVGVISQPLIDDAHAVSKVSVHAEKAVDVKEKANDDIELLAEEKTELTHEEIVSLTDQFMDHLVQDTNESYKVTQYKTKDELIQSFSDIATQNAVQPYIDFYYEEKEDGLYIIPTSTPPWFINDQEYEIIEVDEETKKVVQSNQSEMYGDYQISIEFIYEDGWKISKVLHK